MRYLITGTTGQVGAAILHRFQGLGTIIGVDRSTLDLAIPERIETQLNALAPDIIINPAAFTAVDRAEDEGEAAFTINATSPGVIARWAAKRRVPLVHFSTDYVFDGSGERPWREDDQAQPLNIYGASKLAGERAVEAAAGAHLIVRTSWVYAARGTNFLRTISRLAREREELRIVCDQIGAPTSADCIADALYEIIIANRMDLPKAFSSANGKIHLSASERTTWRGFAEAIVDGLKRRGVDVKARTIVPIATRDYPTKAARPLNSRLDLSRLANSFGIRPKLWSQLLEVELDRLVTDIR